MIHYQPRTVPGELAKQIARVAALGEQYRAAERLGNSGGGPRVDCTFAIHMNGMALDAAVKAFDTNDIGEMVVALTALRDCE